MKYYLLVFINMAPDITAEQGQKIVDSLYNEYAKIYADPSASDRKWFGATFLKWSNIEPIELMKLPSVFI